MEHDTIFHLCNRWFDASACELSLKATQCKTKVRDKQFRKVQDVCQTLMFRGIFSLAQI